MILHGMLDTSATSEVFRRLAELRPDIVRLDAFQAGHTMKLEREPEEVTIRRSRMAGRPHRTPRLTPMTSRRSQAAHPLALSGRCVSMAPQEPSIPDSHCDVRCHIGPSAALRPGSRCPRRARIRRPGFERGAARRSGAQPADLGPYPRAPVGHTRRNCGRSRVPGVSGLRIHARDGGRRGRRLARQMGPFAAVAPPMRVTRPAAWAEGRDLWIAAIKGGFPAEISVTPGFTRTYDLGSRPGRSPRLE
jgi:hypothetical protein